MLFNAMEAGTERKWSMLRYRFHLCLSISQAKIGQQYDNSRLLGTIGTCEQNLEFLIRFGMWNQIKVFFSFPHVFTSS